MIAWAIFSSDQDLAEPGEGLERLNRREKPRPGPSFEKRG
jgi:hypothetical protein